MRIEQPKNAKNSCSTSIDCVTIVTWWHDEISSEDGSYTYTNTNNPKVVNVRSIGAQEPALRRRTGSWGAVGNLSEDGDLCSHANAELRRAPARGARTHDNYLFETAAKLLSS